MKVLEGKASDILKDFVDGKYEMTYNYDNPARRFVEKETGTEYELSEEVNHYLNKVEIIWGLMDDNERWSGGIHGR